LEIGNWQSLEVQPNVSWTQKFRQGLGLHLLPKPMRRMVVAVIGGTLLLIGIVLLVLPGPAFLVIPIGLLILATEFAWARWLLRRGQKLLRKHSDVRRNHVPAEKP
jgi:uncharacterized protein (TIGR02611 family)